MLVAYPKIYHIGHKAILDIFSSDVLIEEKVDGSQFSFCRKDGELYCRSKGHLIDLDAPDKLFAKAISAVQSLDLHDGWVYRGEYLQKPKHNILAYSTLPDNHIALFDIQTGLEAYLSYDEKLAEARRIGVSCVPVLAYGKVNSLEELLKLLELESFLGGTKIEGFVVKNYNLFTVMKEVAMGKYVSEAFKEVNKANWKASKKQDILFQIIAAYSTEVRWHKAVQHLQEAGSLEGSPRDIGLLISEVPRDIMEEAKEEICELLWNRFWPDIRRGVVRGLPEWYKKKLAEDAFKGET